MRQLILLYWGCIFLMYLSQVYYPVSELPEGSQIGKRHFMLRRADIFMIAAIVWMTCFSFLRTILGPPPMLIAQGRNSLYLGYGKDCRKVNLQDVPMEHLVLEEPKAYQEHAVFYHRPHDLSDINGQNLRHPAPERQTEFRVEQVVVLADEEYRQFQETRFLQDQIFLFDYQDKMWFDPGSLCWHCVLVKGENSRDGILVESEGYCYTRYAAFAPDCGKLRLQDIPVHYEYPAKAPEQKKSRKRKVPER